MVRRYDTSINIPINIPTNIPENIPTNVKLKNRNLEISADILICLPSRNSPEGLIKSVTQLVDSCHDRNNFDLSLIIDDDQIELYSDAIKICKPEFISYIPHLEHNWSNIQIEGASIFSKGHYYYFMPYGDDMGGITNEWDAEIISKKHFFHDDIFLLYNSSTVFGRKKIYHENCYNISGECYVHSRGETMPIWTRKLFEFVNPLFSDTNRYKGFKEIIYLTVIYLLNLWYNENRNVSCNFSFKYGGIGDGSSSIIYSEVWEPYLETGFEELRPIIKNIKNYINNSKN